MDFALLRSSEWKVPNQLGNIEKVQFSVQDEWITIFTNLSLLGKNAYYLENFINSNNYM